MGHGYNDYFPSTQYSSPAYLVLSSSLFIAYYSIFVQNLYVQTVCTLHLLGITYKLRIIAMFVAFVWHFSLYKQA